MYIYIYIYIYMSAYDRDTYINMVNLLWKCMCVYLCVYI